MTLPLDKGVTGQYLPACSVTGQYHKPRRKSLSILATQANEAGQSEVIVMKHKALRGLRVVLGLIVVFAGAAGGGQRDGFGLVVQQIALIGPRQWLGLMAGSIASSAPAIAPLTVRIVNSLPGGIGPAGLGDFGVIYAM
jgi:hypothetical protein